MSRLQLPRTIAWAMISMLLLLIPSSEALFAEDAGVLDVLVATAGHGSTRFVHSIVGQDSQVDSMVTSDATFTLGEFPTSCILASRTVADGQVRWRRRVCVNALDAYPRHLVAAHDKTIVTLDASAQVLRAWEATTGDLLWERTLHDKVMSDHLPANATKLSLLHPVPDDATQVLVQLSGLVSREEADVEPKEKEEGEEDPLASALFAYWDLNTGKPMDLDENKDSVDTVAPQDPTLVFCPAVLGKIPLAFGKNKNTITNTEGKAQKYKDLSNPDAYLESIAPVKISLSVQQQGMLQGIFLVDCSAERGVTLAATTSRSLTILLHLSRSLRRTTQWTADEGLAYLSPSALLLDHPHLAEEGDENGVENVLSFASRLKQHGQALQETIDSVVSLFQGTDTNDNAMSSFFGFPKMALLVSETANRLYGIPTAGPRRGQVQFAHNLHDQAVWHRLVHGAPNAAKAVRGVNSHVHHRDVLVVTGFVDNREKKRRTDDDVEIARTHVSWKCLDGATGRWIGVSEQQQSYEDDELHGLDAPVVQIVPVAATGSCRQGALLILENHEVVVALAPGSQLAGSDHRDMFAHRLVHTQPSGLETLQLSVDSGSNEEPVATVDQVVGVTQFPGEDVVAVAYPGRNEVIQSPCHVLGDQSLLLKYLNPHLVVVMTTAASTASDDDSDDNNDKDPFAQAFRSVQDKHTKGATAAAAAGAKPQKRKPTGAGNAAASTTAPEGAASADDDPNLFVNVVDSVSGRVLYRAAHANALLDSQAPPTLLVSENWVFYSFMNERTRRTEIGVLSLYEGMIDSKGLTAFSTGSSPDVITRFSSLDARESKPVVLAKTFSVAKPVTAMGVTHTRGGISGKKLIVATLDGGVYTVDRKMLEPRRPMGQVKESEKEEGLRQYSELVPIISYLSLSYTQPVEGVKYILSAPTELESQTVVLCFGGPDLFVTRTSPSRGFDLLPDSFSRIMLSIVVVVLMGIYLVLQRIVFQKTVRKGWV